MSEELERERNASRLPAPVPWRCSMIFPYDLAFCVGLNVGLGVAFTAGISPAIPFGAASMIVAGILIKIAEDIRS